MFQRIALSFAAAALLSAGPALAQAPAAPAAPPSAQLAPPPAEPKVEKHAKHEKPAGHGTLQTHHCVKDGKLMADLSKKKCTAAGGTWQRDAAAPAAAVKPSLKSDAPAAPPPAPKP